MQRYVKRFNEKIVTIIVGEVLMLLIKNNNSIILNTISTVFANIKRLLFCILLFCLASTTGNNVRVDKCSGEVSIRCSDLNTNQNCTISYQQDGMDFTKTIPTLYDFVLPVDVQDFQVTINNGSTILQQTVHSSRSE